MGLDSKSQQSNYKTHYATLKSNIAAKSGNGSNNLIQSSSNVNATNNMTTTNSSGTVPTGPNKNGQPSIMLPISSVTGKKSQKGLNKNGGYQTAQTTRSAHKSSYNGMHQNSS